jgi:hypothetical protein
MPTRARLLAAAAPWVALVICATACAAAPRATEGQIRQRIVAAAHEAARAKSVTARGIAQLRSEEGGRLIPIFRLEVRIEKGQTLKTDNRRFPAGRWRPRPTNEVVTVGERVWWRARSGRYREATVGPDLADGTTGELIGLERAARVGRDLAQLGPDRYEMTAPASSFDPEKGHERIRLVVTLTAGGDLHRLRRIEGQDGSIVVAETFTDFGQALGITAPSPDVIVPSPVKHITGSDEFSALLGPGPFDE